VGEEEYMKIEPSIENNKLVLSHKWSNWIDPNTTFENKFSVLLNEIETIIERVGVRGGFKGLDILSKKKKSYSTSINSAYETHNKLLKSYTHYDRDARELFKELQELLKDKVEFKTILDK